MSPSAGAFFAALNLIDVVLSSSFVRFCWCGFLPPPRVIATVIEPSHCCVSPTGIVAVPSLSSLSLCSSSLCLYSPSHPPIACPPSLLDHSRFWCYSDWCSAYGLTLCVPWTPILITVSGALIPECNGLLQFNEDTLCTCPRI